MDEDRMFSYTLPAGETPSEGVIKTIATLEDCDPTALDTALYTAIDPDALDALFGQNGQAGTEDTGCVVFEYLDYEVTVRGNGTIGVRPPTAPTTEQAG